VSVLNSRERIALSVVTAIRETDLTAEQLTDLADAIRVAPADVTPRALAEQAPFASKVIAVASKADEHWIELLAIAVTLFVTWLTLQAAQTAHRDAEIAHHDAEVAREDAQATRRGTGRMSKEEPERIAREVEQKLEESKRGG
jgi:hypothetical protein